MGQNQVKISIDNYLISMYQLKNNKILIQGDRIHSPKKMYKQYRSIFKFKDLSKQFKSQFLNIEDFIQKIQKNEGLCCGGRSGIYNYKLDGNMLIIKKHNKNFIIQLTKIKNQQQISQNDEQERVSLQYRLQRHNSSKLYMNDEISNIHLKSNTQNFKQQNELSSYLHMTKHGLSLNLCIFFIKNQDKQNIGSFQLKFFQKLDVKCIHELDLNLEQIFQLQWKNLKKLHLDTNRITTISGLYLTLKQLEFLSLSNNQLGMDTASFFVNNQWPFLEYFKIQLHNRQLAQQTVNNFRIWQNSREGRQITYRYFHHPKLTHFVRKF